MNQVDMQCHGCQQTWRWSSGDVLRCPYCHRMIQIEPARDGGEPHDTGTASENHDFRRRGSRKAPVMAWRESKDAAPVYYEALTPRQAEVLDVLVDGAPTNGEIAAQLAISPYTVERHLSDIYQKLGVASRYEAIVWWLRHRQSPPKDG